MIDDSLFNRWLYSYVETYGPGVIFPKENSIENEYFVSYETIPYANKKYIYGDTIEAEPVFHQPTSPQNRYELPAGEKSRKYYLCFAGVPGGSFAKTEITNVPTAHIGKVTKAAIDFIENEWKTCNEQKFHVLLFGYLKQGVMKSLIFYSKTHNGITTDYNLNLELIKNGYATFMPVETGVFVSQSNKRDNTSKYDSYNSNTLNVETILSDIARAQTYAIKKASELTSLEDMQKNVWKARTSGVVAGTDRKLEELSTGDNKIQICTYNVKDFEMQSTDNSNTVSTVAGFVRSNGIDICIFIETPEAYTGAKLLEALNNGITDKERKFTDIKFKEGSATGATTERFDAICVASRYPITHFSFVSLNGLSLPDPYKTGSSFLIEDSRPMIKVTVKINGVELDIFALHLKSGVGSPMIVDTNDIDYYKKGNMHIRRAQAYAFYETIKQSVDIGRKVIVLGDFNTTNQEEIQYKNGQFSTYSPLRYITGQHQMKSMYYVNENSGPTYKNGSGTVLDHIFVTSNIYMSINYKKSDNNTVIRNCSASDHWPLVLTLDIPPIKTSAVNKPTTESPSITKPSAINVLEEYTNKMNDYTLFRHSKFKTVELNDLLSIFRTRYVADSKGEDTYYCIIVTETGMSDLYLCGKLVSEDGYMREVIDYNLLSNYLKMFHDYDKENPRTIGPTTHVVLCKMLIQENVIGLNPTMNDLNRHTQILNNTELTKEDQVINIIATMSRAAIYDSKQRKCIIDTKGNKITNQVAMMIYESQNAVV